MCRRVTCSRCGGVTWTGCGQHVDQVMRGVNEEDKCRCHDRHNNSHNSNAVTNTNNENRSNIQAQYNSRRVGGRVGGNRC